MPSYITTMLDANLFPAKRRFVIVVKVAEQFGILGLQGKGSDQKNGD